jgi:hypothetical protein
MGWKSKVAEEMFAMTTCIQSGEELLIPDIWHGVMIERDVLRTQLAIAREALERISKEEPKEHYYNHGYSRPDGCSKCEELIEIAQAALKEMEG